MPVCGGFDFQSRRFFAFTQTYDDLQGHGQPMGGYFAVSTLLFYFSCDLRQSKKVRTRRLGIPAMSMNTEIM